MKISNCFIIRWRRTCYLTSNITLLLLTYLISWNNFCIISICWSWNWIISAMNCCLICIRRLSSTITWTYCCCWININTTITCCWCTISIIWGTPWWWTCWWMMTCSCWIFKYTWIRTNYWFMWITNWFSCYCSCYWCFLKYMWRKFN